MMPNPTAPRIRSPETWERAREAYLGGMSAPEVCERFQLGRSALRERARKESWRRADQPEPDIELDPDLDDDLDDDAPAPSPAEMAELAWRRAARAAKAGRLQESLGWTRLCRQHRELEAQGFAQARRRVDAEVRAIGRDAKAAFAAVTAETAVLDHFDRLERLAARYQPSAATDRPDSPDSPDSENPPRAPLNRAERRRAAAEARNRPATAPLSASP